MSNHQHTLIIDGTSGISGDMTVAALLDLGASEEHLREQLATLPVDGFSIAVTRVNKHGIDACDFDVQLAEELENHDHDMAWLYGNEAAAEHTHEHEHHHHDHDEHDHHHEHHYDENGVCSCGHHHDHDADEVFTSWGKETAHKYSREDLDKALHALDEGAYGMILRAKGIVDGGDTWYEFDMVPGEHEIRTCGPDVTGKLCVIGSQLKEHEIAELFHV